MKPIILAFWKEKNGRLFQKRLTAEAEYVREKSIKNRGAARQRWHDKFANPLENQETLDAFAMRTQYVNDAPTPTPTPTPKIKTSITDRGKSEHNGHHGPNSARAGAGLENGLNGSGQLRGFALSTDTAAWLASHAAGWDENFLAKKYMGWLNGKETPRNPQAAFRGWVKKFTKERPPS